MFTEIFPVLSDVTVVIPVPLMSFESLTVQDQCGLFQELQQAEKKNAELQQNADFLRELKQLAPDKLSETIETVKERKKAKYTSSPLHSSARQRSK